MIRGRMRGKKSCENSCGHYGERSMDIETIRIMINWVCKKFGQLTPAELYKILRLRSEVFVVEQQCIFLDMDNKDYYCDHLLGWQDDQLLGYSRIVPSGISYTEFSIGRIVSSPAARGKGIGRELVQQSI